MVLNQRLFIPIISLSILGIYFFYGASLIYSEKQFGDPYYYFKKFLIGNFLLGFLFFFLFSFIDWKTLRKLILFIFILNIIFTLLAFIPKFRLPGQPTARWFHFKGLSFQPSEFLKLTTLLFVSFIIPFLKRRKKKDYIFLLSLAIIFVLFLIYNQPALANLLILSVGLLGGFLSSNLKEPIIILSGLMIVFILFSFLWGYRVERVKSFLKKGGFQALQTRLAIGSGGILGKGIGKSELKLIGIPLLITDSIFAVYGEETGFLGSIILISLFLYLILTIFSIGREETSDDKRFFIYSVGCWISAQAFLHIASNLAFIPPVGIALPFFSYGPSSQISIMSALGIINRISSK
ncbi:MAG: FtsW/RodA/SpoVE family cell cycle protein [Minisyncoccia bacterium]